MTPADYAYQFMNGFSTAAGNKAIDSAREQHADEKMRQAWMAGWSAGKAASVEAQKKCSELYGYKFQILRAV